MISAKAKEITKIIYTRYGSDTGILFGIDRELHSSVEGIVQSVLNIVEEEKNKGKDK